eukprot:TRINITY_DN362_c0_g1_i1.p1 TRINITY_DN362_c0_g1~~TRINITY_DN362_c0_g1_i1.p1  ORF type:complete len:2269 (+),score=447.63 TRINITY_DN362_c0_g1_i1:50-6856(+)
MSSDSEIIDSRATRLLGLFRAYCYGESSGLTSGSFYQLLRDALLLDSDITVIDAEELFHDLAQQTADGPRMDFPALQRSMTAIGLRKFANIATAQREDHLLDRFIFQYCSLTPTRDVQLDLLASADAVLVIRLNRTVLGKLYTVYSSTFGSTAWSAVADAQGTMLAASFAKLTEDFTVCPELLGRGAIQRLIRVSCSVHKDGAGKREMQELNFAEFIECIMRCAEQVCSREPFSSVFTTTQSHMEALMVHMHLNEPDRLTAILRKADRLPKHTFDKPAIATTALPELPPSEELNTALWLIFVYYCNFGQATTSTSISTRNILKLIRDCHIRDDKLTSTQVDVILAKFGLRELNDEAFIKALEDLAERKYPGVERDAAYKKLLALHILPFAQRAPSDPTEADLRSASVQDVFKTHEIVLRRVFAWYCQFGDHAPNARTWDEVLEATHTMNYNQFLQFTQHFEIVPQLLSRFQVAALYRNVALGMEHVRDLKYEDFCDALGRLALAAYSKHPYGSKYPTSIDKVNVLLDRLGVTDPKEKKWQDKMMVAGQRTRVPASLARRLMGPATAREVGVTDMTFADALPRLFARYSSPSLPGQMRLAGFIRLLRDARLLDTRLAFTQARKVFRACTTRGSKTVDQDQFVSALRNAYNVKYPPEKAISVSAIDKAHMFPLLTAAVADPVADSLYTDELLNQFEEYLPAFQRVFASYGRLNSWPDALDNNSTLDVNEVVSFCTAFEIMPDLVPKPILRKSVTASNMGFTLNENANKHARRPNELYFPEFIEFIARCGLIMCEKYPYNEQYPSPKSRVVVMFKHCLLHDTSRLNRKLSIVMSKAAQDKLAQTAVAARGTAEETSAVPLADQAEYNPDEWDAVLEKHRDALFRIFTHFSLKGEPGNTTTLTRHKFDKLVRACDLLDDKLTHPDIGVIFSRVCRGEADATLTQHIRMTFPHFASALCYFANKKYPNQPGAQALSDMLTKHVLPRAPSALDDQADVIDDEINALLTIYRRALEQVFATYCVAEHEQLSTWEEQDLAMNTVNFNELLKCFTDFSIVPQLMARSRAYRVFCESTAELQLTRELRFDDFCVCMVKAGLDVHAAHFDFPWQRVEALFKQMELDNPERLRWLLKRTGRSVSAVFAQERKHSSPRNATSPPSSPPAEIAASLGQLEEELRKIFVYYCTFGEPLNLQYLSAHKFATFVRECKMHEGSSLKPGDVHVIFWTLTRNIATPEVRMPFDRFYEALFHLAGKLYPDISAPTDAFHKLVTEKVLPHAPRVAQDAVSNELDASEVKAIWEQYMLQLKQIFGVYCMYDAGTVSQASWAEMAASSTTISFKELNKIAYDFRVMPGLLSRNQLAVIYRSITGNDGEGELDFNKFVETLGQVALAAFDKQYTFAWQKVESLCHHLDLHDPETLKKRLRAVRGPTGMTIMPIAPKNVAPREAAAAITAQPTIVNEIRSDAQLQSEMQRIYNHYCAYGKPGRPRWMNRQQMYKFARDCRLFDNKFWIPELDSIILSVAQAGLDEEMQLTLDSFCEAVLLIAERTFEMSSAEALDQLLATRILPFATRAPADIEIDAMFEPATVALLTAYISPLQAVFTSICSGKFPAGFPQSYEEVRNYNGVLTLPDALRLWESFNVVPALLAKAGAIKAFRSASMSGSDEVTGRRAPTLTFPEFVECVVRAALSVSSREPYNTTYITTRQKVEALLVHMNLDDADETQRHLAALNQRESPATVINLTSDTIKSELEKIFSFYCNYSNATDVPRQTLSDVSFTKFVRDSGVMDNVITLTQVDMLLNTIMKDSADLDNFKVAVQKLASIKFPKDAPEASLAKLMTQYVLRNTCRPHADSAADELLSDDVLDIIGDYRDALTRLFVACCAAPLPRTASVEWDDVVASNTTVSFEEFAPMAQVFDLCPRLLSRRSMLRLYNASMTKHATALHFPQFVEFLGRCALTVCSEPPYSTTYATAARKVEALFVHMQLDSLAAQELKISEYLRVARLPRQQRLDELLRPIFAFYSAFGELSQSDSVNPLQVFKFARDCRILDNRITLPLVRSVIATVADKAGDSRMSYPLFCAVLNQLAAKKFGAHKTAAELLTELVDSHVLPYATKSGHDPDLLAGLISHDAVVIYEMYERALQEVFVSYCNLDDVLLSGRTKVTWDDIVKGQHALDFAEFSTLAGAFQLMPGLVSRSALAKAFCASSMRGGADPSLVKLCFPEFVECLARCALACSELDSKHDNVPRKIEAVFAHMGLHMRERYQRVLSGRSRAVLQV